MPDFIRVTWIDVDRDKERDVTQEQKQTYELAVNLKENEPTTILMIPVKVQGSSMTCPT